MRNPLRRPPKLSPSGVPIDTRDWTEADWADLHYGIKAIQARIAARHTPKPSESDSEATKGPRP